MPKADSKWVSISMTVEKKSFSLSGSEVKEVLTNWKPIFTAVAQGPAAWDDFKKYFPKIAEKCDKLLKWSESQNGKSV